MTQGTALRTSPVIGHFAISLTVCLPFLIAGNPMPARAFESDMLAITLGILAAIWACLRGFTRIPLPNLLAIPLALIGMIGLQALFGRITLPEFAIAHAAYLAWAALMLILAALVAGQTNRSEVLVAIAAGLLAAATINAVAGLIQCALANPPAFGIRGLVGQYNRLATLLWLGILSACHLHRGGILGRKPAILLILLLSATSVLTGQRMAYLLCIGMAGVLAWTDSQDRPLKQVLRTACVRAIGGIILLWLTGFLAQHLLGIEGASAADRAAPELLKEDRRITAWRDTLTIIANDPWLGVGAGNFRRAILDATAIAPAGAATIPDLEHAHNLILQWFTEFGIPFTLAIVAFGIAAVIPGWRAHLRTSHLMPAGVIVLIGIHSLLEYPLWFAEFLGPVAFTLGAVAPARRSMTCSPKIALLILLCAQIMLVMTFIDYRDISAVYAGKRDARTDVADLARLTKNSIVSPYAYAIIAARMQPSVEHAPAQAEICEKALRVWPSAPMTGRCVHLHLMAGHTAQGDALLKTGRAAFRTPKEIALFERQANVAGTTGGIQRPE